MRERRSFWGAVREDDPQSEGSPAMYGERMCLGEGQCARGDPQREGECFGVRLSRGPAVSQSRSPR